METLQARHSINRAEIETAALGGELSRGPMARAASANQSLMAAMLHQAQLGDGERVVPNRDRALPSTATAVPAPTAPVPTGVGVRRSVLSRIKSSGSMAKPSPAAALLRKALSGGKLHTRASAMPPPPPGGGVAAPPVPPA